MRKPRINRRTRVRTEHCHILSKCTRAQSKYKLKNLNAEKACVFGEVITAENNPTSEAEEDHAAEEKASAKVLLERRRLEVVLGQTLAAEVVTARTDVCRKALSAFCNSLAARVQGWRRYCGQAKVDLAVLVTATTAVRFGTTSSWEYLTGCSTRLRSTWLMHALLGSTPAGSRRWRTSSSTSACFEAGQTMPACTNNNCKLTDT